MSTGSGTATGAAAIRIQPTGYQAIIWCSAGVSFGFVLFRLYVRLRVFKKLFLGDALVVLSWLLLLVYSTTQQIYLNGLYAVVLAAAGAITPGADFAAQYGRYETDSVASNIVLSFGLWSVKFAFLAFFKRLGNKVRNQKVIWWTVACFNVASWAVWLGVVEWKCITPAPLVALATCNTVESAAFSEVAIRVQTAMDVVSDCSIIIIPVALLWHVQIHWRQKFALAGIFSLTVFTMAASIVRGVVTVDANAQNDNSWLYGWAALDLAVSIIIACLASFRALFTAGTMSHGMPHCDAQAEANATERRGLARLGFASFSRSEVALEKGPEGQPEPFGDGLREVARAHAQVLVAHYPTTSTRKSGSGGINVTDKQQVRMVLEPRRLDVRNEYRFARETI